MPKCRHAKVEKEKCMRTAVLTVEARRAKVRVLKGGERGLGFLGRGSKPPSRQLGGLVERGKLPQQRLGQSPSRNQIW